MKNKSNILNAAYDAILIDTCIYFDNDFALESGLLKKLNQFKWLPIDLLMPDIIEREIIPKLIDRISAARRSVDKAIRQSKTHLQANIQDTDTFQTKMYGSGTDEELAKSRFSSFIEETGAITIACLELADMEDIMNRYFDQKPPFGTKNDKKSEFPDAIVLKAVEAWASQNNKKILAVSTDKDWFTFAAESDRIDIIGDLAEGLAALQTSPEAFDFSRFLAFELLNNRASDITKEIDDYLSDKVIDIDTYPDASSSYYYEADYVELNYDHFEYSYNSSNELNIEPIHIEDNFITLDFSIAVYVDAFCNFKFFVKDPIDKDYVQIGALNAERKIELDFNVLVTLECDFTTTDPPFSVIEVELIKPASLSIDFDIVDPSFDDDDYYDLVHDEDETS